jgi:hypothetical protein
MRTMRIQEAPDEEVRDLPPARGKQELLGVGGENERQGTKEGKGQGDSASGKEAPSLQRLNFDI